MDTPLLVGPKSLQTSIADIQINIAVRPAAFVWNPKLPVIWLL